MDREELSFGKLSVRILDTTPVNPGAAPLDHLFRGSPIKICRRGDSLHNCPASPLPRNTG